ncbi:DUF2779 domain-containing protein [Fodinibius salsisoli]|uniref:DUF2779 domain-containing protein n=1 Tax=Fodinibius salsisoli TaxID=2820877 RepID=A0ABT3PLH4_9BACT|nr:DUF2779 domain-containing protein [Fodinibius salsisoli]MCW9706804.1 DUF2779 domain-containing protein [Fodinibius salsisoli]
MGNTKKGNRGDTYFTKHLFRAGLQCATKLFYKAHNYPQNREALPFIRHARYNKKLLKSLVRSIYPEGKFIDEGSIAASVAETKRQLEKDNVILFDAVFTHQQMMAKLPVIVKSGDRITAIHIRTKAFSARKHQLLNNRGTINSRWRKYMIDFAFQLHVFKQQYPDCRILPLLVLPDKLGYAQTDALPIQLQPLARHKVASDVSSSNQQLLVKLDVSDPLAKVWEDPAFAEEHFPRATFAKSLDYLKELYLDKEKTKPELGYKCKSCEFRIESKRKASGVKSGFARCWKPTERPDQHEATHVFDLIGPGTKPWIQQGTFYAQDVDAGEIPSVDSVVHGKGRISEKLRQALQIHKAKGEKVPDEIIRPPLIKELRRWKYPLHFLDFEAGNYAVPIRKGRPPYHLVVFQFSCHTLQKDGSWQHHQWIDDLSSGYPNYELIRQLMKVPNIKEGTIVQYSNFERNALKVIRRELREEAEVIPDSQWLMQWIDHIVNRKDSKHPQPPYVADLSRQVKHFYYNSQMENSLSIKDVLQSAMSQSAFLKEKYSKPYRSHNYDDIVWWQPNGDGGAQNPYTILKESSKGAVKRGTEAMVLYGKLIAGGMSKKEKQASRQSLLRYCELDTLAMVMIYEHWKQKMNQLY